MSRSIEAAILVENVNSRFCLLKKIQNESFRIYGKKIKRGGVVVTTPESYSGGLGLETGCPDAEIIY
jgi:hypothetical protein